MGRTLIGQVVGYCMGNKNDIGSGGSISPPAGDIGPPLSWTWVWNGAQNRLEKRRIWTVGGVVRCMGFLESWVLVSIWVSSHYDMYRNGILTFGPSSWGTGDLGTRNWVTLAKRACFTHYLGPLGQSDPISGSQISGAP